jgi:hypothetical protein
MTTKTLTIITCISIPIAILITFLLTKKTTQSSFQNKLEILKENHGVELEESTMKSYEKGLLVGNQDGQKETKRVLEAALLGSKMIFADEDFERQLNTQKIVHNLHNASGAKIKSVIQGFSDHNSKIILNRIASFGEFSTLEFDTIVNKLSQSKKLISDEMYSAYQKQLSLLNRNPTLEEKAQAIAKQVPVTTCAVLEVLSPQQKIKIAAKILEVGNQRIKHQFRGEVSQMVDFGIQTISERLCMILMSQSEDYIADLIYDYAISVNFAEKNLVGKHNMKSVVELVTAKSNLDLSITKTFERLWGYSSANYVFRADANVIAGIDLNKFYCVEFVPKELTQSGKTEILVTLPKPQVLSVYTNTSPYSVNKRIFTTLESEEIKAGYDHLAYEAKNRAISEGILVSAENGARGALHRLFEPLMLNSRRDYIIKVHFAENAPNMENMVLKG